MSLFQAGTNLVYPAKNLSRAARRPERIEVDPAPRMSQARGGSSGYLHHSMALLRVLLGFANASDHEVEETAGHVSASFYSNPIYPDPPVSSAALQAAVQAFTYAIALQEKGGPPATAAKNQARDALVALLRQNALYVQTTIQANPAYGLAELLSSG